MKTNIFIKLVMLLVVATFSIYQVKAQTYGEGNMGSTGCIATGTGGNCTDTYVGQQTGVSNTGFYNSFFGDHAGFTNGSATGNVFTGYGAGWYNTGGSNTFLGVEAGYYNTSPSYGTFIGANAGFNNTTGGYNTILGYSAGYTNTTGGYNTLLGYQTGHENTTASYNLGIGHNALYYNQTGQYNTVIGVYAGQGVATNSYSKNNFIGYSAGFSNTTGTDNTANGYEALYSNTTGLGNTADGYLALYSNTTGGVATGQTGNTAVGYQSLYSNSTGGGNTASGDYALNGNTTGGDNTAYGNLALESNTTTSYNTAIGYGAGSSNATCDHSTFVGYGADATGNYSNATAIGNGASVLGSDRVELGNTAVDVYTYTGHYYTGSDGRFKFNITKNVPGLEFINKLCPVTYQMDTKKLDGFLNNGRNKTQIVPHTQTQTFTDSTGTHTTTTTTYDTIVEKNPNANLDFSPSTAIVHSGFIAQQVAKAAKAVNFNSSIVSTPADSTSNIYALSYAEIVVPLVKAVQELSKTVDSLKAANVTGSNQRTINNNGNNEQGETPSIYNIELANNAILYQNAPNPFGDGTSIKYFVPDNINALIVFYDEFGTQLKIFNIAENGTGQLNVDASNLASGMYSYSLIVNGKVIDTKKMIRNK